MTLEVFREAAVAEARAAADAAVDEARRDAEARVAAARDRATSMRETARSRGREVAEREAHRRRSRARRRARERVLVAQREVLEQVRDDAIARLCDQARAGELDGLFDRQAREVRELLGDDATIEVGDDGLVARRDGRSVDDGFEALVDRAMEDLGAELEVLWP